MSNVSSFFGEGKAEWGGEPRKLYDLEVNVLGKLCGIDKEKLSVLLDTKRNFLTKLSDILLIDPQGRLANAIGRPHNQRYQYNLSCAEKDIFCRRVSSAILLIVPYMLYNDAKRYGVDNSLLLGALGMQVMVFIFVTLALFLARQMGY